MKSRHNIPMGWVSWMLRCIQDFWGNFSSSHDKFTFLSSWEWSNLFDTAWCFTRRFVIVLTLKRRSLSAGEPSNSKLQIQIWWIPAIEWIIKEDSNAEYYGDGIRLETAARFIFPCCLCLKWPTFAYPLFRSMGEIGKQRVFFLHVSSFSPRRINKHHPVALQQRPALALTEPFLILLC